MEKNRDAPLRDFLAGMPELAALGGLLEPGQECYLVGGLVRDLLLGRSIAMGDIDLLTSGDPSPLARRFAARIHGHFFFMDEERGHSRVVVSARKEMPAFDFAPFRAADLAGDLGARDFTLNALAWPLHLPPAQGRLIDPLEGWNDCRMGLLRRCAPDVLQADPLRVLRGVRLAVQLNFAMEEETQRLMEEAVPGLRRVAGERILAELGKIFSSADVLRGAALLREVGCLAFFFGPATAPEKAFAGALELLKRTETCFRIFPEIWLAEEIENGWSRAALLRFAALLQGCGVAKEDGGWQQTLPFSRNSRHMIGDLATVPAGLCDDYLSLISSNRGKALWLCAQGKHPLEKMIFSFLLAGDKVEPYRDGLDEAFYLWEEHVVEGRIPPLVSAEELRKRFGLPAGPRIGELLRRLAEEEISGEVGSREEALKWLRRELERD